jgi:hypothetical protein
MITEMVEEILQDEWRNLYGESWTGVIAPEAFSHPAKYSRALIRAIYDHVIEEKWVSVGDSVVDPFGGVGLGGLDAMTNGLHWIGCELEAKFHGLGNQNIALWNERWSGMPNWGSAVLLQGDSRKLASVISEARIAVSSPPYVSGGHHTDVMGAWNANGRGHGVEKEDAGYGAEPGQLGALKEGDLNLAISSPPFLSARSDTTAAQPSKHGGPCTDRANATADANRYGDTPGQLGDMRPGDVDAAVHSPTSDDVLDYYSLWCEESGRDMLAETIQRWPQYESDLREFAAFKKIGASLAVSSPPYAGALGNAKNYADPEKAKADSERDFMKMASPTYTDTRYGNEPGQLGAMPEGKLCVSSPPFPQPYTGGGGINAKGYGDGSDKVGDRTYQSQGGDRAEGNLEVLPNEGFDLAVSSPPYAGIRQDGGKIAKEGQGGMVPYSDDPVDAWFTTRDQTNLGNMRDDEKGFQAAITSPPHEHDSEPHGDMRPDDGRQAATFIERDYGATEGNISASPDTFWSASRTILEQLYSILTPGAHCVFVVKAFVRNKQIVDFPGQWAQLCESVGFKLLHDHHALLVEHSGTQGGMFGEDKEITVSRKSFFRRLHERRSPETAINFENVLCFIRE